MFSKIIIAFQGMFAGLRLKVSIAFYLQPAQYKHDKYRPVYGLFRSFLETVSYAYHSIINTHQNIASLTIILGAWLWCTLYYVDSTSVDQNLKNCGGVVKSWPWLLQPRCLDVNNLMASSIKLFSLSASYIPSSTGNCSNNTEFSLVITLET